MPDVKRSDPVYAVFVDGVFVAVHVDRTQYRCWAECDDGEGIVECCGTSDNVISGMVCDCRVRCYRTLTALATRHPWVIRREDLDVELAREAEDILEERLGFK